LLNQQLLRNEKPRRNFANINQMNFSTNQKNRACFPKQARFF